ncbi:MbcA/ParS/Xre antitoxin family protein [Pseudoalteromonas sp. Angola-7]|jgi:uncharacterized protein (DUF2384 family)|uniref:MbcA/ParS/Xre antitoxin family protein n=1 Tax=Pseudoalteromonas sp. Angola-7 TaxID=3025336 RepID=UPI002359DE0C|nr:MbcA/ParS/Xre antitoxin family protein [Pseudoalteromonas sp. Angola-7]MDC9530304.1 MbcA/ParS/Xre antitoxin family protein [Pseudoalteromonas sp. Angola-7]
MSTLQHKSTRPDFLNVVTLGKLNTHSNPMAEIATAQIGITTAGLRAFSTLMHWEMGVIAKALGTTERTLLRNKEKPLNKQISENALEIARLSSFGAAYFGNIDSWNTWLDRPNVQFDNQPPRSMMDSIRGRELIRRVINGLQYGFTA